MKWLEEIAVENREFSKAEKPLRATVEDLDLSEVEYFMKTFAPRLHP